MTKPCPICREHHGADRRLSFDGCGVNSCDMYRTRIATIRDYDIAAALGPLFAAAPDLLAACKAAMLDLESCDYALSSPAIAALTAAIARAEGKRPAE